MVYGGNAKPHYTLYFIPHTVLRYTEIVESIYTQLALILGCASIFGFLMRKLNLPLLIAYLLVGIVISTLASFNFSTSHVAVLPDIGIAFMLFLIGMELDFREITSFGGPILIAGLTQIVISGILGVTLANLFGFRGLEAMYLGVGLCFSSTVVIVKMMVEKRDLNSLYGKLSIGVTLLEDMVAVLVLMFLSLGTSGAQIGLPLIMLVSKAIGLFVLSAIFSKFILPKIFQSMARSPELLFLTALTWCFAFISVSVILGFSVIIGAFLAGIALASRPFHYHISARIKPLRDFFIVLFFVYLGSQVGFASVLHTLPLILAFTAYALCVKPLIFLLSFGAFGFRKHTIFQAAMNLSQISEFSLIILLFGEKLNLVGSSAISVMALTVALSITLSSIAITHSRRLYRILRPFLNFFERKGRFNALEDRIQAEITDHVVVVGANNIGRPIIDFLKKENIPFLVLDFDPKVIERLNKDEIIAIYGDLGDSEVLENLHLETAKLVISTASDPDDNKMLLSELKRHNSTAKVVLRAEEEHDIEDLKKRGADYIILPESVSADFLVSQLEHHWPKVHFGRLKNLI